MSSSKKMPTWKANAQKRIRKSMSKLRSHTELVDDEIANDLNEQKKHDNKLFRKKKSLLLEDLDLSPQRMYCVKEKAKEKYKLPEIMLRGDLEHSNNFIFEDQFIKERYVQSAKNTLLLNSLMKILDDDQPQSIFTNKKQVLKKHITENIITENQFNDQSTFKRSKGPKMVTNSLLNKFFQRNPENQKINNRKIFSEERSRKKQFNINLEPNMENFTFYQAKEKNQSKSKIYKIDEKADSVQDKSIKAEISKQQIDSKKIFSKSIKIQRFDSKKIN